MANRFSGAERFADLLTGTDIFIYPVSASVPMTPQPLSREEAREYAEVLEMVRIGPSASKKQPWRNVTDGADLHL